MTNDLATLETRLLAADSPNDIDCWHEQHVYYSIRCRITVEDVPRLVEIAKLWADPDWPTECSLPDIDAERYELLPVTAWRSLAELSSEEAVEGLVELLCAAGNWNDDWIPSELPKVFGKIGAPALAPLIRLAQDQKMATMIRMIATDAMSEVVKYHPECRTEVVPALTALIEHAEGNEPFMNGQIISQLVDLQATEAAEAIERAFAANFVDTELTGDWETARTRLGVPGLGLEMPSHRKIPFWGSVDDVDGESLSEDEREPYLKETCDAFGKSPESQRVIERFGGANWIRCFLRMGLDYQDKTVAEMDMEFVNEFLFEYSPRNVMVDSDQAEEILFELECFWEFQQRELAHPEAPAILQLLKDPNTHKNFRQELADPSNYGMAKSIFMTGVELGYDMTTTEGISEFMVASSALAQDAPNHRRHDNDWDDDVVEPVRTQEVRVGRNDPCPCGSGKKFKKCCHH